MANTPEAALAKAQKVKELFAAQALQNEIAQQQARVNPEITSEAITMQPQVIQPNSRIGTVPSNVWSTGNLIPGPSGESKLAATWNPSMDPAGITNQQQNALGWNNVQVGAPDPWIG